MKKIIFLGLSFFWGIMPLHAGVRGPETVSAGRFEPLVGTHGMVVSDSREASEWGAEVLRKGGNAIDAAVATAFVLAVTRPHYAALGGGGFLLYCPKPKNGAPVPCHFLDYREVAPLAAHQKMYLQDGKVRSDLAQNSPLASGVPGTPAGLLLALEKYGTRKRAELLSRAIEIAERGFVFTGHAEQVALERWSSMNGAAQKIFGCADSKNASLKPCSPGTRIVQKDLARTLKAISRQGRRGFYDGKVAKLIVTEVKKSGGLVTLDDLRTYSPRWREPIEGAFQNWEVVSAPPPSSGGLAVLQLLQYTQRAAQEGQLEAGPGALSTIHAITHAMSLVFADRAEYLGDPDFVSVPVAQLISNSYLDQRWKTFDPKKVTFPQKPEMIGLSEGRHTTHFSVIDREGNAVAITTTLNDNFGSGFVPAGSGVVMNNEMDDFSIQPGVPNLFGLIGSKANAIAPRKRPLSSMSPSIVRDQAGNNRIVIGAAGGPRIISSVFLSLLNRFQFGMPLLDAVAAPRFHHQWQPKELFIEKFSVPREIQVGLMEKGYVLAELPKVGLIHALERSIEGKTEGAPDPRGEGAAVAE